MFQAKTITQIYLIRHAQSKGNAHREQGLGELPKTEFGSDLTDLGISQSVLLSQEFKEVNFHAIYSSHLARAQRTALILKGERALVLNTDRRLAEREREIENDEEAISRFRSCMLDLAASNPGKRIAVVAHGFVICGFLADIGFVAREDMYSGFVQNTGHALIEYDGKEFHVKRTHRIGKSEK